MGFTRSEKVSKVSKGMKGIILLPHPRANSGWLFVRERVGKYLAKEGMTTKVNASVKSSVEEGNV
jgi:hypothetical protein